MAKAATFEPPGEQFEGVPITRHRIGLYAASDLAFEDGLHIGDWVQVVVRGKVTAVEIEQAKDGVGRKAKVTVQTTEISHIEAPDDNQLSLLEGRAKLDPETAAAVEAAAGEESEEEPGGF